MIKIIEKEHQGKGQFNGGQIMENKPIGFPQDGGNSKPFSNLFYWAHAKATVDSTIGLHPHQGFEIMSFVQKGNIRHYDTKQNQWIPLEAGDVQIIRAGKGIQHAEHMHEDSAIFQIWLDPNLEKTLQQEASYNDYKLKDFPLEKKQDAQVTTFIGPGSPLNLDTPGITIVEIELLGKQPFIRDLDQQSVHSIYVKKGTGKIGGQSFKEDDFVIMEGEDQLNVIGEGARLFLISSPIRPGYSTYSEMMQARLRRK